MKFSYYLFAAACGLALGVFGCSESTPPLGVDSPVEVTPIPQGDGNPCGDPLVVDLLAGQHIDVGEVTIYNDTDDLFIEIAVTGGWVLTETHVAVATTLDEIPQTGSGNPQVGHFDLAMDHDPPVDYYVYQFHYEYEPGQELFVAVHGAVQLLDDGGNVIQEETAWADGYDFPGNSWATYFNFTVAGCEVGGGIVVTVDEAACIYDPFPISWAPTEGESLVDIELLRADGTVCTVIATFVDNSGSYGFWEAYPQCQGDDYPMAGTYRIRVTDIITGATGESPDILFTDCGGGPE